MTGARWVKRPIGGPEVMTAQLKHLLDLSELPNVVIRVVPRSTGILAAIKRDEI